MTDIFFSIDGVSHRVATPEDMQRALGNAPNQNIIMTDESGAVIGFGNSIASLNKSVPLVKSLREEQATMAKALHKKPEPRILFAKSESTRKLGGLVKQLEQLKKSTTVNISDSVDESDFQYQLDDIRATLDDVADYLEYLIAKGILPAQA